MKSVLKTALSSLVVLGVAGAASVIQAAPLDNCPNLTTVAEQANNHSLGDAQNLDGLFNTEFCSEIEWGVDANGNIINRSDSIEHVTVVSDAEDSERMDWYSFTVDASNTVGVFDIDFGEDPAGGQGDFDSVLELLDSGGNVIASNDDMADGFSFDWSNPDGDETFSFNSFLKYNFGAVAASTTYYLKVSDFSGPIPDRGFYTLNVSLGVVPEPGVLALFVIGVAGAGLSRRGGARRRTGSDAGSMSA